MTTFLTLVIYVGYGTAFVAGAWLVWNRGPNAPVACLGGKAVSAAAIGEDQFGAHPIFDVEVAR